MSLVVAIVLMVVVVVPMVVWAVRTDRSRRLETDGSLAAGKQEVA